MLLKIYTTYNEAVKNANAYAEGRKHHPGMRDKQYRVYYRYGEYQLRTGTNTMDFPEGVPVYTI